jgi:iron-sulfur cluster insertion protein
MEKKLEFTDSAKNQIEKITKSDEKKYFRISVQGGGCSGFKYNFSFDNKIQKDDILFNKTLIDKQ